jgi:Ca-activated chloride channel homolog
MEYSSPLASIIGFVAIIFWSLEFWKIFQKPQLINPVSNIQVTTKMIRLPVYILGTLGLILLSYSMMGPRKPLKYSPSSIEVNDIFLVVDLSRSMLADDIKPNRLEVAKNKLKEFAKLRPTDRIGIIMFSEKVFTLLPLTTDPELVVKVIEDMKIGFLGSGTNIGDALALAVARGKDSETKNKVIVLLTDGVNNVGNLTPIQAAQLAKEQNMKVYTIGLGTENDAKIPLGQGLFGMQYQNIPGGSIDFETLKEISDLTGGKMYKADSSDNLRKILDDINKLEKTKILSQGQIIYDELFFSYLLYGLLLFLTAEFIRKFILKEVV